MSERVVTDLVARSIELIHSSAIDADEQRSIVWSLEHLPDKIDMDHAGYYPTEEDPSFPYQELNPYELGTVVALEAANHDRGDLVYDWSALLLNLRDFFFADVAPIDELKSTYLPPMKRLYQRFDFGDYQPRHEVLKMFPDGAEWFSDQQNELIKWFCH